MLPVRGRRPARRPRAGAAGPTRAPPAPSPTVSCRGSGAATVRRRGPSLVRGENYFHELKKCRITTAALAILGPVCSPYRERSGHPTPLWCLEAAVDGRLRGDDALHLGDGVHDALVGPEVVGASCAQSKGKRHTLSLKSRTLTVCRRGCCFRHALCLSPSRIVSKAAPE